MQNLPERTEHAQKARAGFKCVEALGRIIIRERPLPTLRGWWRSTVVERRSLTGELSLSCARPAADG